TSPPASGTLKSTRTRTRFPRGSKSRMVRLANATRGLAAGGDRLAELRGDKGRDVGETAGVPPLVVVPGDHLDHVAEHDRVDAAHDRRVSVALEIARDQRIFRVVHDPLELARGRALEGVVHLGLRDLALQDGDEV